jgi:hypothetical protein
MTCPHSVREGYILEVLENKGCLGDYFVIKGESDVNVWKIT